MRFILLLEIEDDSQSTADRSLDPAASTSVCIPVDQNEDEFNALEFPNTTPTSTNSNTVSSIKDALTKH